MVDGLVPNWMARTCCVHVRMPDLDPHVPSLKQFAVEAYVLTSIS